MLNASRLGSIAALGVTDIAVYAKPRVAVLSTGNEIVEPGQPLAPGQIYDINRVTVSAVVGDNGGVAVPYRTASDTIEDLQRAVNECLEQDVMVFSGGSSVGERDLVLDVVAARGEMLFHGIAVKPGKPTAFGRRDFHACAEGLSLSGGASRRATFSSSWASPVEVERRDRLRNDEGDPSGSPSEASRCG